MAAHRNELPFFLSTYELYAASSLMLAFFYRTPTGKLEHASLDDCRRIKTKNGQAQ
jgi:hypothetical protein